MYKRVLTLLKPSAEKVVVQVLFEKFWGHQDRNVWTRVRVNFLHQIWADIVFCFFARTAEQIVELPNFKRTTELRNGLSWVQKYQCPLSPTLNDQSAMLLGVGKQRYDGPSKCPNSRVHLVHRQTRLSFKGGMNALKQLGPALPEVTILNEIFSPPLIWNNSFRKMSEMN